MSGNYDSEELLDGSRESSAGEAEGEEGSVLVNPVDSPDQVERIDQDDGVLVMGVDTIQDDQNDVKVIEDGGKDDMFVDCPDELVSYDGKISLADNSELMVTPQKGFEEQNETGTTGFDILDRGRDGDDLTSELEHLRALLKKTVGEKESLAREYEAEKISLRQGLANLHHQLNVLGTQGLVSENDGGSEKSVVSDTPLEEVIYDCSMFVQHLLDKCSKTEGAISEQQDAEAIANRVLNCLAPAVTQDKLLHESFTQKMCLIENSTSLLVDKYNNFLSEADLLRQCITNVRSDHIAQDEMGSIFHTAREELLEIKRKEVELSQKEMELEEKNWKQMEELKRVRETVDAANAEIQKTKLELEHEKARYNNTKEKLSLAVTKGKALVQHRDSLKQSLADKTNELERCLNEIQEKSSALEAAELCKQELIKSEILAASLQEELSERNTAIESCERLFVESYLPEEIQSMDIIRKVQWLAEEKNKLTDKLQDMTSTRREVAIDETERLTALILAETQEKHYLQEELEDLRYKYNQIVEKETENSLAKDQMVRLLHEASGVAMDITEGLPSDIGVIIDQCFAKIKEQTTASIESWQLEREIFEKMQSLLYMRDQEATLFEEILEGDMLNRSEVNLLANKVAVISQELCDLRDENNSLQNTLSRSEEKATLLREKLSMAVKKGKGVVQERENLKQLLDRTRESAHNEIDQLTASILTEAQEKNYLLDELNDLRCKYEWIVEREQIVSQEKNRLIRMLHEASGITMNEPEELHSDMDDIVDRCLGGLREQNRISTELSQVEPKLFERIQSLLYTRNQEAMLFETILEDDMLDRSQVFHLENKILLLSQELHDLKDEKDILQNKLSHSEENAIVLREDLSLTVEQKIELVQEREDIKQLLGRTKEVAHDEIDRLTLSLLAEMQEKHYYEEVFEEMRYNYEEIIEKERQTSLEKVRIVRMLQEASGIALNDSEEMHSDIDSVIDHCFINLKEQTKFSIQSSQEESEIIKGIQSLLYIRDFEAMLFQTLLEEEMLNAYEVNHLTNKLAVISKELHDLKDEKDSLLNDLSRSEEKATLIREKLSMAVKKGKGLVQERENMKQLLDEKNALIEKLQLELEQRELSLNDYRTEIHKLSTDADCVQKLELDLNAVREQRDQLEQFLAESNRILQGLMESIESIRFADGSAVGEPAEKVKRLAGYISECEAAKEHAQRELEIVKEEADTKFNNLALAEAKISVLVNEKEDAQVCRAAAEMELQKVKEEASSLSNELAEAHKTVKSLEDTVSQVQTNLSLLAEENNMAQVGRKNLESEIEKLKEEAGLQAHKLANASSGIKSYKEAIWKAENTISELSADKEDAVQEISDLKSQLKSCMQELGDKQNTEQEITDLKSQLDACMQELAGTRGTNGITSPELYGYLNHLLSLLKDDSTLCLLRESFNSKFDSLKYIDHILKDIRDHFNEMDMSIQQKLPISEEDSFTMNQFPDGLHTIESIEMVNEELDTAGVDNLTRCIGKTVDHLQSRNKFLADVVETSSFMDKFVASLSRKLVATRDEFLVILEHMNTLKQHMKTMEMHRQEQDNAMGMVENNIANLLSACTGASLEIKFDDENNSLDTDSFPEMGNSNISLFPDVRTTNVDASAEHQTAHVSSKYIKTANELLSGAEIVQKLIKQFQYKNTIVANLQSNLKENSFAFEKAIEERDLYQSRISKLEADLETLETLCSEMRHKLGEHQAQEDKWQERETELMSLYSISKKEKEAEDTLLSTTQMKSLFKKIDGIKIPTTEFKVDELEPHDSDHVKKLFYIVDCVDGLQRDMVSMSRNNELQQSVIKDQAIEIENLKEEVSKYIIDKQDYENTKYEMFELARGLDNIVKKLGGNAVVGTQKTADVMGQLLILEKLVTALILESDNSKSKAQELDSKILQTQEVVDELSSKVKFFEQSKLGREASAGSIQEQGAFEAQALPTRSEISEIEDVGPLVNIPIPPAASNAHVRSLRKGSSDQLAINIDSESDRLISKKDTSVEKGHAFKSLNTSGLVPRQGKTIADRIDGIWVSGDRALMSRPRARIGVIIYWLFLNLWLLGTIL